MLNRVLSAPVMRSLRDRFAAEADRLVEELIERREFDAIPDLAEAYPLTVFPDAMGMSRENRRFLLPYGNMVFNSFGPQNEFFKAAVAVPSLCWRGCKRRCSGMPSHRAGSGRRSMPPPTPGD